ncbi:class I SAM-dependent methyltransferase [Fructobacillus sp. M1-13]|uniref:Class I SAM-dependent methyltransferase n=1 Tax=Fructobacillus papyriferae TaxID=2713171 RepID=A0ABS5QSR2_9LACO|nr:class I SAM-dependent methyltransferase [Fructobacillus papyriferae]MBS9335416.1 class I SAM-dependent methyltransferase [Fructobacillus papyriferae]MCD2158914.1 class I SAM-dependent methyltransferase [Fructobacillus papyriferae]
MAEEEQPYQTFASLYDELFDGELYEDWAAFVKAQVSAGKVLDLGGGAGRLAVLLAKAGYQMDLLDLSAPMLELAQEHAAAADVDLRLLQADIREFSDWEEKYPAIVSFADTFNYLPEKEDFLAGLKQAYDHLEDGGTFLFDVITPKMVNEDYLDFCYNNDEDPDKIFMWTAFVEEGQNAVDHDLKFFLYQEDVDAFKLVREVHHEKTYEMAQYLEMLQSVGFESVLAKADFGQKDADDSDSRWFFICKKGAK